MTNLQLIYFSAIRGLYTYGGCVTPGWGLFMCTKIGHMYISSNLNTLHLVIRVTYYGPKCVWL